MSRSTKDSRPDRNDHVFINCPFDDGFKSSFEAITFTVLACELNPRCALEASNAGEQRIDKIQELVSECDFGIHDLSFVKLDPKLRLPRMNMPFEYGIQLREAWLRKQGSKRPLVSLLLLEGKPFTLQKCLSDSAGIDPKPHGYDRKKIVMQVRNWLRDEVQPKRELPAPKLIIAALDEFDSLLPDIAKASPVGHEADLSFTDLVAFMRIYLTERKPEGLPS